MMTINDECFECGACVGVCPKEAISEGTPYKIDPKKCNVCGACVEECSAGAISNVPLFRNTGKFPPSNGDVILLYPTTYVFVDKVYRLDDTPADQYVVDCHAEIADYRGEAGYISIEVNNGRLLGESSLRKTLTPQQEIDLREILDEMDLEFDYGYKKLVHKPHQRVSAGSTYWYINDKMGDVSAVDDGAATGVAADRFRQLNYFKNKDRALLGARALQVALKSIPAPKGAWK